MNIKEISFKPKLYKNYYFVNKLKTNGISTYCNYGRYEDEMIINRFIVYETEEEAIAIRNEQDWWKTWVDKYLITHKGDIKTVKQENNIGDSPYSHFGYIYK